MQLLKIGGARHITILEVVDKKKDFALKLGANMGLNPNTEGKALGDKVIAFYDGNGADVAFECAGVPQALQASLSVVKRGGQVIVIGVTSRETPLVASVIVRRETEIKGSFIFKDEDIRLCFDFMAQRRFNTREMISDVISIDDIVKGLNRLAEPNNSLVKILVTP